MMESGSLSIQQSRNLPHWLWIAIMKSLGIKLRENEKPILATIFSFLTYTSCVGFVVMTFWFTVYDIISDYTKTTVIDGSVTIIYSLLWGALGIYARRLSRRLFSHPHFSKLVKLHAKTILKVNAAVLLLLLMTLFTIVNNVVAFHLFSTTICRAGGVKTVVCHLRFVCRVLFSAFALLWNYLVSFVLSSVCRSHVLRLRRFMKILQEDAANYERSFLGIPAANDTESVAIPMPPPPEYLWVEDNYFEDEEGDEDSTGLYHHLKEHPSSTTDAASTSTDLPIQEEPPLPADLDPAFFESRPLPSRTPALKDAQTLSTDEILFNYWKIQTDVRVSSMALQRWMVSVISLVAIWLAINLVLWLTHDPDLVDLTNFLLPLLLLPLLTSAFAEVNQEGQRLLKFICLTEARLKLLLVLQSSPLQMTVYSYGLSYKTIATASFGVLLALASKILIQKILK